MYGRRKEKETKITKDTLRRPAVSSRHNIFGLFRAVHLFKQNKEYTNKQPNQLPLIEDQALYCILFNTNNGRKKKHTKKHISIHLTNSVFFESQA